MIDREVKEEQSVGYGEHTCAMLRGGRIGSILCVTGRRQTQYI
jgi:hypothetical protein